jgi:DDE superfamily endonuclease
MWSGVGGSVSSSSGWRVSRIGSVRVARAVFPPEQIAEVKAIACGLPRSQGVPLSRFSRAELHRLVVERGVCEASASTIARWLAEDAIKPWRYRSWIFPTDPDFEAKAGRVLDLYQGRFEGRLLDPGEFVICADEKPSIQARRRTHETLPPGPGSGQRVEHTYKRGGALTYLAAWDVRRGQLFGRSEAKGGIEPFGRLVRQVMNKEPYASARQVFWIVDNGSSHRGKKSVERLQRRWRNLTLIHLPLHASWLNQIEIAFSIIQRKLLTPNDFDNLADLARTLNEFELHYNEVAQPFDWRFTRADLHQLMCRLTSHEPQLDLAA